MNSEKGQSLVEFALVLPFLLLLLFGIVDFARAYHAYLTLDHAGREAARMISIGSDGGEVDNKIASSISGLDSSKLTPEFPNGKSNLPSGTEAIVKLKYKFYFITPLVNVLDEFFDTKISEFEIRDTTVMRVE